MRHARLLTLLLLAVSAVVGTVAGPALAKETGDEKKQRKTVEQASAATKHCRLHVTNSEESICFAGITSGGPQGGFFQLGEVKVPLSKPITLQGGTREFPENSNIEYIVPPETGETLESPELKVPKGLNLITPAIEEYSHWPSALKAAFKEAKNNKETGMKVKIEVAGTQLYEIENALNVTNLVFEQGPAFTLPLKVRIISPWLEKLGGGPCEIGNDAHPVFQHLTTERQDDGSAGVLDIADQGNVVVLTESRLGDFGWPVEPESFATGCGGPDESYVDQAINWTLGLANAGSSPAHGVTLLAGNLYEFVREAKEEYEAARP